MEDYMHTVIKFAKIRPTARVPTKREKGVGYDVYADFSEDFIVIEPHTTKMIPTGIASSCDNNYCFIIGGSSDNNLKKASQCLEVISSEYNDEWLIPITNISDGRLYIGDVSKAYEYEHRQKDSRLLYLNGIMPTYHPYDKPIAHFLLIPVPTTDIEEYASEKMKIASSCKEW